MDIDARMDRLESKIDDLRDLVEAYHQELLRNYYTKVDVDRRLEPLPGMMMDIAKLKQALMKAQNGFSKSWDRMLMIVLLLILILAQLLGVKLPDVVQ